jgi:hypothetical protein
VDPKTPRSRRSMAISQANLNLLREHRKIQAEKRLKKGSDWHQHDLILCTRDGKPIQSRNILRRHLRPILKAAGLPHNTEPCTASDTLARRFCYRQASTPRL